MARTWNVFHAIYLAWSHACSALLCEGGPRGCTQIALTCCTGINDATAPNSATIATIARIVIARNSITLVGLLQLNIM